MMSKPQGEEKPPAIQISSASVPISPRSNDEKVASLIKQTGIEKDMAREFLESNGWNLNEALIGYKQLLQHEKETEENDSKHLSTSYNLDKRKISRGFSLSNFKIIQDEREKQKSMVSQEINKKETKVFGSSSHESFVLPDISMLDKDVAYVIKTELISRSALQILTSSGRLNWWAELGTSRKFFPLSTVGDGNCLLHAVSLGMWGFHDRMLILRKALYQMFLNTSAIKSLKRRWKYNLWRENMKCGELTYTQNEWDSEWSMVVKLTSIVTHKIQGQSAQSSKRITRQISLSNPVTELEEGESLDSLEPIHVYALANLLCRPIIVLSEDMLKDAEGHPIAPIPFGGIYLPLEQEISRCYKYPLILAYESSHFSALVPADGDNMHNGEKLSSSIPLQAKDLSFLSIKFAIDPGSTWDMVQEDSIKEEKQELTLQDQILLLRKYLDVVKVPTKPPKLPTPTTKDLRVGSVIDHVHEILISRAEAIQPAPPPLYQPDLMIVSARINMKNRPKHYKEMIQNFIDTKLAEAHELREIQNRCPNCGGHGIEMLNGYCEWCYERTKMVEGKSPSPKLKSPISTLARNANKMFISENKVEKKKEISPKLIKKSTAPTTQKIVQPPKNPSLRNLLTSPDNVCYPPSFVKSKCLNENPVERSNSQIEALESGLGERSSSISSISSTSSSDSSGSSDFLPGLSCKVSGCNFYGGHQTLGFCSSCYRNYNKNN